MTPTSSPGPVVILGMHRSGTSALGGVLSALGVHFGSDGALYQGDKWNELGYYEYKRIVQLNDDLLRSVGSAWDAPPDADGYRAFAQANHFLASRARQILQDLQQSSGNPSSAWGFKDPRTALTWDFWQPLLEEPRILLCLRSPAEVAASLKKRNNVSTEFAMRLCSQYFHVLLRCIQGRQVKAVHYVNLVENSRETLRSVAEWLSLPCSEAQYAGACSRIKAQLAHQRSHGDEERITDAATWAAYRKLLSAAAAAESRSSPAPTADSPAPAQWKTVDEILAGASAAWRAGDVDAALRGYWTAFSTDGGSLQTTRALTGFLLIKLAMDERRRDSWDSHQRAIIAYLCLQPANSWVARQLCQSFSNKPASQSVQFLLSNIPFWSPELQREIAANLHQLIEDPQLRTQIQQALDRARSGTS